MHNFNSDCPLIAGLKIHAGDEQIKFQAKILAKNIDRITERNSDISVQHILCEKYAHRKNISPPVVAENLSIEGAINRMLDHQWWVRQIRTKLNRLAEREEIYNGTVHRFASTYVSNRTLNRRKAAKFRNRLILESLYLVNEEGTELNMLEVSEHSIANPANKRAELMCRIAGFEEYAKSSGDAGVFLTFTCPSRMHARHSKSGKQNVKYDGSTPKESNQYLNQVWQRIRAKLARDNIQPYGFRVAEPQHDETPHWHLLLFVEKHNIPALIDICKTYNLQDTPDEPGAKEHRFRCVYIDWNRGSAAGYIAKYIAKNIDGAHIEKDTLGNDAKEAAEKVEAWAST